MRKSASAPGDRFDRHVDRWRRRAPGDLLEIWFRPKPFETERLYVRLGARILKRYVPTGGDLVMQWLRRRNRDPRLIGPSVESLRRFERLTRVAEAVHLIGALAGALLAARRFRDGSLSNMELASASVLNLTLGLWPVVLQRYNRLRLYRAMKKATSKEVSRRALARHMIIFRTCASRNPDSH
jgi:hypothetical protein